MSEKFDRVAQLPQLSAVDISMSEEYKNAKDEIKNCIKKTGLKVNCVMMDSTSDRVYRQGSLSNIDRSIRQKALDEAKEDMDFALELGCNTFALWPGQDGYDYRFQADYERERRLFEEGIRELSQYRPEMNIAIEYKPREPRNFCYMDSMAGTLLMIEKLGLSNVGVAMDYGHSYYSGENPAEAVALLHMYGGKLMAVHMNDNYGGWDDDMIAGSVNTLAYLEYIYWLRRTEYNGYITFDQFPYREESQEAVRESACWLDYLESILDSIDPDEIECVLKKKDGIAASRLMRRLISSNL